MIRNLVASDISLAMQTLARGRAPYYADLRNEVLGNGSLLASGRAYARYIGVHPIALASVRVWTGTSSTAAVAGAGGAGLNWAELAIATSGAPDSQVTTVTLTALGSASIDTEVRAGSQTTIHKTITVYIPPLTHMWLIMASAYETTQVTPRVPQGADYMGLAALRDAYQPSLNIGTPLAFTTDPTHAVVVPSLRVSHV